MPEALGRCPGGPLGSQSGIFKSQVSRICADIDVQVQAFLSRPLEASGYAYLYLDATYLHGRLGQAMQVCSMTTSTHSHKAWSGKGGHVRTLTATAATAPRLWRPCARQR